MGEQNLHTLYVHFLCACCYPVTSICGTISLGAIDCEVNITYSNSKHKDGGLNLAMGEGGKVLVIVSMKDKFPLCQD